MPYATTDDGVRLYYEEAGGGGDAGRLRARIRGRHALLGAAVAAFRTSLPRAGLQCARLSALGGAGRPGPLRPGARRRRYRRRHGRRRDRPGACLRALHGRVRHAAFRLAPCRARPLAGRGRMRLRSGARQARAVQGRGRGDGGADRAGRHEDLRRHLFQGADPRTVREQGPARLARVPRPACRTFAGGRGRHHARRPGAAALALRPDRRDGGAPRADPGADRRRGLALPAAGRADEADHSLGGTLGHGQLRPYHQYRGTGRVQPHLQPRSSPRSMPAAGRSTIRAL